MRTLVAALLIALGGPAYAELYQFHTTQIGCEIVTDPFNNFGMCTPARESFRPFLDQMTISLDGDRAFWEYHSPPFDPGFAPGFGPPPNEGNAIFRSPPELQLWDLPTIWGRIDVDVVGTHLAGQLIWNGLTVSTRASGDPGHWDGIWFHDMGHAFTYSGHWSLDKNDVPEPGTLMLLLVVALVASLRRNR